MDMSGPAGAQFLNDRTWFLPEAVLAPSYEGVPCSDEKDKFLYIYAQTDRPGSGNYGSSYFDRIEDSASKHLIVKSIRQAGITNKEFGMSVMSGDVFPTAGTTDLNGKPAPRTIPLTTIALYCMGAILYKVVLERFDRGGEQFASATAAKNSGKKKTKATPASKAYNSIWKKAKQMGVDPEEILLDEAMFKIFINSDEDENIFIRNLGLSSGKRKPIITDEVAEKPFEPFPNGILYANASASVFINTKDDQKKRDHNLKNKKFLRSLQTSEAKANSNFEFENLKKIYRNTGFKYNPLPLVDLSGKPIERPDTLTYGDVVRILWTPACGDVPNTNKISVKMKAVGLVFARSGASGGDGDDSISGFVGEDADTLVEDVHARARGLQPKIGYPAGGGGGGVFVKMVTSGGGDDYDDDDLAERLPASPAAQSVQERVAKKQRMK